MGRKNLKMVIYRQSLGTLEKKAEALKKKIHELEFDEEVDTYYHKQNQKRYKVELGLIWDQIQHFKQLELEKIRKVFFICIMTHPGQF
jgi:hypothetical protein